jgi:AraC family transcriptional regulator
MSEFKFVAKPTLSNLNTCSTVLSGTGRRYHSDPFQTALTIKSVERGAARYRTPQAEYLVLPDNFLILNHGQEYTLDFEGPTITTTVCPFFQTRFVEHAAHSQRTNLDRQLDEIEGAGSRLEFPEQLYPKQGRIARLLHSMPRDITSNSCEATWLEDRFYALAESLVQLRQQVRREIMEIPAARPATRKELFRRLHRGRDYMASCYSEPLTVASVAKVAQLSPYHFHRMFSAAFRKTPMQFLQDQRLAAATRLLTESDEPVTSICLAVGFESLGSFSWLFTKRMGLSPRACRNRPQKRRAK